MEPRISLITLGVENVDLSRRFYERLGWRASTASTAEVTFFQASAMVLALWGRKALARDAGLPAAGSGFGGIAIAHNVRSRAQVDAVLAEAEQAGGRILKAGGDVFWGGYTGYFADPDGHAWEIAWNPHWDLLADGAVKLPE